MISRLRTYFFTGLVAVLPIAVSIYILWTIFNKLDGILASRLEEYIGRRIPGAGLVSLVVLIILVGAFTRNIFGRGLFRFWEEVIGRIPLIGKVYSAIKRISEAFFSEKSSGFRKVVLVEYPRQGTYSIAFMTAEASSEIQGKAGQKMVSVFLPTTPNPTSGFFLLFPRDEVRPLDITVDEALRMIISAGMAGPDEPLVEKTERKNDED